MLSCTWQKHGNHELGPVGAEFEAVGCKAQAEVGVAVAAEAAASASVASWKDRLGEAKGRPGPAASSNHLAVGSAQGPQVISV